MPTPPRPPSPASSPAEIQPRVVVTGHDPDGKSVVVEDSTATPIANPGLTDYYAVLWGIDELPRFPDDGARPLIKATSPGIGAARFVQMILPPAGQQPLTVDPSSLSEMKSGTGLPSATVYPLISFRTDSAMISFFGPSVG